MADVTLGRAGSTVLVDLDTCVKTGATTTQRVTLRGSTTPSWITVLLLFTVIGFLIATAMTSRRYRVTLPFSHGVYDRWRHNRRLAWGTAAIGAAAVVMAATRGSAYAGVWIGVGIAFMTGGLTIGTANALRNNVGIRVNRDNELVVTRAHANFTQAVRAATVEPLAR